MSRGSWLCYLDADDELAPDSIAKKMEQSTLAEAIYGTMEWATFCGTEKTGSIIYQAKNFSDPWVAAFHWDYPNTSSFLFNRSALLDAGGWDESVRNCTDYALYFPLLFNGARFRAAPEALSLYRNWSATQATKDVPVRKMKTRLQLMSGAAEKLHARSELTPARKMAFQNMALGAIRMLSVQDLRLAKEEHSRLIAWARKFCPSRELFSWPYVAIYNVFGFAAAERLAKAARLFHSEPQR